MVTSDVENEMIELFRKLPLPKQQQALGLIRTFNTPLGTPGHEFLKFAGIITNEEAKAMDEAVAECRRIDLSEW